MLSEGVATVDAEISTGYVPRSITKKEGNCTHEIFGSSHLAGGNERGPLVTEIGVLVQDLAGAGLN